MKRAEYWSPYCYLYPQNMNSALNIKVVKKSAQTRLCSSDFSIVFSYATTAVGMYS
jgi:hypothetical protein